MSHPTKEELKAEVKALKAQLEQIKIEIAADFEARAKIREAKWAAEIVRLNGLLEQQRGNPK